MPTIDIEYTEFEKLLELKMHMNMEKVNEVLEFAKGEVKLWDEKTGVMSVEIKDTSRPDVWSVEGLARALRGFLGLEIGLRDYKVGGPAADVYVDSRLNRIRPYIGCSIVKDVKLSDSIIRGLMHMQDKLDQSYGRNRQRTSIGLYDFDLVRPPLTYGVVKPTEISFAPLDFEEKMNLREILQKHPKGLEYSHIIDKHNVYPILLDVEKKVLSFPPIINSNDLGKITSNSRNILIEVTGTMHKTVLNVLKIVTLSLADRGGKVYSTKVHYPKQENPVITPTFEVGTMDLDVEYINKVSGLKLTARQIAKLLPKAGYDAKQSGNRIVRVRIPCYRVDIMHPVDLVEDITITYGYNKILPLWRRPAITGGMKPEQRLLDVARELVIGLGFQEVFTYTLTNPKNLFSRMNLNKQQAIEIANPKVQTLTCLRNWLLPSLMEFLNNNSSVEYPQKIFELGKVTLLDEESETRTKDEDRLAAVVSHANASFSEIKSNLDVFFMSLGLELQIEETKHPSFIDGRVGTAKTKGTIVGILGEVHPKVLTAWKLENPTSAFELNMQRIIESKQR